MPGHVRARKDKDGNVRKRADGSTIWQARWRPKGDPSDGNRRERNFRNKSEAREWITDLDSAYKSGGYVDPRNGNVTIAMIAEDWQTTWLNKAPKTRTGYESILNKHVLPAFGEARVAGLKSRDVQALIRSLAETHEPNTVKNVARVLSGLLTFAVDQGYIASSPMGKRKVTLPTPGDGRSIEITPLTHGEVGVLVNALPEHWRLPALLTAYTALRAGELWALRRRDIDLLRGDLLVDEALKEVNAKESSRVPESKRLSPSLIVGKTKTHETRRLKLPEFIRPMLAEHLAGTLPGGHAPDAFIFTMPTGAAVRHNNFYKRTFQPAVRAALPHHADYANRRGLRFHDLRHTCAAWLIAAGIHPYEIQKQLGHKDIRTTLNTYGHLFPSSADAVAGALNVGYAEAAERGPNVVSLR